MVEDNLDDYRKANQNYYDDLAAQFRTACLGKPRTPSVRRWQKELKERMKLLDFRFKGLGEE